MLNACHLFLLETTGDQSPEEKNDDDDGENEAKMRATLIRPLGLYLKAQCKYLRHHQIVTPGSQFCGLDVQFN